MTVLELEEEVSGNIFIHLRCILPEWEASIRQSSQAKEMQDLYIALLRDRVHILDGRI